MNDTPNYAVVAEPAIYTEQEMKVVVDKLQDANERLVTLGTDFDNYRARAQERKWNLQRILVEINRNSEIALKLHNLRVNNAAFMEGYNNARVAEVLDLLTEDNIAKLKELKESQS